MKTIELKIYNFDELSDDAKQRAINNERECRYNDDTILDWIIDDCYLLNPPYEELQALFGDRFDNELLIKNTRNLYIDIYRRYIDVSDAMDVTNEWCFLKWLGLNDELIKKTSFVICKDTIDLDGVYYETEFTDDEICELEMAKEKFENFCVKILDDIERSLDYYYSDGGIKEYLQDEYEFLEDGAIYNG